MQTISKLRLINRALIKAGQLNNTLAGLNKVIEICETYNIAVRVGTDGGYLAGPYIDAMYLKIGKTIDLADLWKFLGEISEHLDMYSNNKPYTLMEISVYFILEKDKKILQGQTQIITWYDNSENKITIKAVGFHEDPIKKLSNKLQERFSKGDISFIKEENEIFSPINQKVKNAVQE